MEEVAESRLGIEGKLCLCFSSFTSVLVLPGEILSWGKGANGEGKVEKLVLNTVIDISVGTGSLGNFPKSPDLCSAVGAAWFESGHVELGLEKSGKDPRGGGGELSGERGFQVLPRATLDHRPQIREGTNVPGCVTSSSWVPGQHGSMRGGKWPKFRNLQGMSEVDNTVQREVWVTVVRK